MHENGDLYVVNGTYCHRLSPDLQVVAEHRLDADNAHNGHVVLSDGNLVTKDISDNPAKPSVFTVLDPDLAVVDRFVFPWNSVGRLSQRDRPAELRAQLLLRRRVPPDFAERPQEPIDRLHQPRTSGRLMGGPSEAASRSIDFAAGRRPRSRPGLKEV